MIRAVGQNQRAARAYGDARGAVESSGRALSVSLTRCAAEATRNSDDIPRGAIDSANVRIAGVGHVQEKCVQGDAPRAIKTSCARGAVKTARHPVSRQSCDLTIGGDASNDIVTRVCEKQYVVTRIKSHGLWVFEPRDGPNTVITA